MHTDCPTLTASIGGGHDPGAEPAAPVSRPLPGIPKCPALEARFRAEFGIAALGHREVAAPAEDASRLKALLNARFAATFGNPN